MAGKCGVQRAVKSSTAGQACRPLGSLFGGSVGRLVPVFAALSRMNLTLAAPTGGNALFTRSAPVKPWGTARRLRIRAFTRRRIPRPARLAPETPPEIRFFRESPAYRHPPHHRASPCPAPAFRKGTISTSPDVEFNGEDWRTRFQKSFCARGVHCRPVVFCASAPHGECFPAHAAHAVGMLAGRLPCNTAGSDETVFVARVRLVLTDGGVCQGWAVLSGTVAREEIGEEAAARGRQFRVHEVGGNHFGTVVESPVANHVPQGPTAPARSSRAP